MPYNLLIFLVFQDPLKTLSMSLWTSADDNMKNYWSHCDATPLRRRFQIHLLIVLREKYKARKKNAWKADIFLEVLAGIYSVTSPSEINQGMLWSYQQRETRIGCQVTSSDEDRNLCGFQPTCTSSEETASSPVSLMKPLWTKINRTRI